MQNRGMTELKRYRYAAICSLLLLSCSLPTYAQSPSPAANGAVNQDNAGFYRGWTLGTSFEGSTSGDGSVYDLGTSVGYNFSITSELISAFRTISLALRPPSKPR